MKIDEACLSARNGRIFLEISLELGVRWLYFLIKLSRYWYCTFLLIKSLIWQVKFLVYA